MLNLKAAAPDKIILMDPFGATFALDVPKGSADSTASKSVSVTQYDSVWIDLPVDDASKVGSVLGNQQPLSIVPREAGADGLPGKSVKVLITRDLSSRPGNIDLSVFDKSGKLLTTTRLTVSPCATCKKQKKLSAPSTELLDDIRAAFARHEWRGSLIVTALADENGCGPGEYPHQVSYQTPDGHWVTQTICM